MIRLLVNVICLFVMLLIFGVLCILREEIVFIILFCVMLFLFEDLEIFVFMCV